MLTKVTIAWSVTAASASPVRVFSKLVPPTSLPFVTGVGVPVATASSVAVALVEVLIVAGAGEEIAL